MAYPYVPSAGILTQPFLQFRKSFPKKIDAETLKRLGIAPSNEGYVIQTLKFLQVIDKDGQQTPPGLDLFSTHGDEPFATALQPVLKNAYKDLFELRGDEAWSLDRAALITFFRSADKTSEIVGGRQANTFSTLATLAGKRQAAARSQTAVIDRKASKPRQKKQETPSVEAKQTESPHVIEPGPDQSKSSYGLTVRIEVNLPANGSPETYDAIFKSIRVNLLNDAI